MIECRTMATPNDTIVCLMEKFGPMGRP